MKHKVASYYMDKKRLHIFFEGLASIQEGIEIKNWVEKSEANKRFFFKERKLYDAISVYEIPERETNKKMVVRRMVPTQWIQIASIILLTLVFTHFHNLYRENKDELAMNTITVPAGQRTNVILQDGTSVWLNSETTLKYSTNFNSKQRKVILRGEAYFEVVENKARPFIVETERYSIEVLGTHFNVNAYPNNEIFETALMKGCVKVASLQNKSNSIVLLPNQKVYTQNKELHVTQIDNLTPYRWKEGLICFQNATFQTIMKDFEKYYGIKIIVSNKEILKYKYTGKFKQMDGIDYTLQILQRNIHFKYEKDIDKQLIYIY